MVPVTFIELNQYKYSSAANAGPVVVLVAVVLTEEERDFLLEAGLLAIQLCKNNAVIKMNRRF
jgi:hypothetical protein